MENAAHAALERVVYHLVLLDARLALKGAARDHCRIMIVVAGEIGDSHFGVRKSCLDQLLDLACGHRHGRNLSIGRRQFLGAHVRGKPGFVRAPECADRRSTHSRDLKLIAASGSKKDGRYSGASGLIEHTISFVIGHAKKIAALILSKEKSNRSAL